MSFRQQKFRATASIGQGPFWTYETEDTTTADANYFLAATSLLRMGDVIFVTVLTDQDKAAEAYASQATLTVTVATSTTVTTVPIVNWQLDAAVTAPTTTRTSTFLDFLAAEISNGAAIFTYPETNRTFGNHQQYLSGVGMGQLAGAATDAFHLIRIRSFTWPATPVHYAELRLVVNTFLSSPNVPTFRIRMIKPAARVDWPTATNTGSYLVGHPSEETPVRSPYPYTTAYYDWSPQDTVTGVYKIDVTDMMNEVIRLDASGTIVYFVLESTEPADGVGGQISMFAGNNGTATNRPTVVVYPSLNHRDYQSSAITNGTVGFFWPLDATDLTKTGDILTQYRSVVANGHGGARADVIATNTIFPLNAQANRSNYTWRQTNVTTLNEPSYPNARKLFGPLTPGWVFDIGDPLQTEAPGFWPMNFNAYSVLCVAQFPQYAAGSKSGFFFDVLGLSGWTIAMNESTNGMGANCTSGATTDENTASAYVDSVGAIKTLAWYRDTTNNKWYHGYHNGSDSSVMTWSAGTTIANGANIDIDGSGFGFSLNTMYQGIMLAEFSSQPRLGEIKQAVARIRELWKAGVKSLPPILFS